MLGFSMPVLKGGLGFGALGLWGFRVKGLGF